MDPSSFRELHPYPHLRELVRVQLDMQFADLRTLLQLPREDLALGGGCNLTAATLVFNIAAGSSVLFYDSSIAALENRRERGKRFKDVFAKYYPWSEGEDALVGRRATKVVYDLTRNPLTHTLGVSKHPTAFPGVPKPPGSGRAVWVSKRPLVAAEVDELVRAEERPGFLAEPTLTLDGDVYTLHVPTLAWGLHQMLRGLFRDADQAKAADQTARDLLGG